VNDSDFSINFIPESNISEDSSDDETEDISESAVSSQP
jgi:hypothetical protein